MHDRRYRADTKTNFVRHFYGVAWCCFALITIFSGHALAASDGIRPLENGAIAVELPGKVSMIAITRAGDRLVAVGAHGVIIYSDNNGKTWRQSRVPVSVLLTAVKFATPSDGWAVGHYGVILHTVNGGTTWQLQLDGVRANQLMLDAANARIKQDDSAASEEALRRAKILAGWGPDMPFLSILSFDANDAIVVGAYRMAVRTADGGKTWTDVSQNVGDPVSHHLYDVAKIGSDICVAGEAGHVFCSSDGGDNFLPVMPPTDDTMFGIIGSGDNGMLVFGVAGQAYLSDNFGQTWQSVSLGIGANLVAARVLNTGAVVVASEDGRLLISYNHAKTFSQLNIILPMAVYDLEQAASGDVIVAGNIGVMRIPAQVFSQN